MKTLLEMGQYVAIKSRIKVPLTMFGNTDKNARLILSCIQDAADEMVREYNWTQLIYPAKFAVALGKSYSGMPSNFDRLVDDTVWSVSEEDELFGPLSYEDWQAIEFGRVTPRKSCFSISNPTQAGGAPVVGHVLSVYSRSDTNELSIYYCSIDHVYTPGISGPEAPELPLADTFTSDNQSTVMDCKCVQTLALSKTLQTLGMSYADELGLYNDMMKERVNRDRGSKRMSLNSRRSGRSGCRRYANDPIGVSLPYPYR